jgi:hypothetical protein
MSVRTLHFTFNSAITGVSIENGKWSEVTHRHQILPLRGRLMQCDGITGINIGRYEMDIEFLPNVTDAETVITVVNESIDWASKQEGLFPLRGDKLIEATLEPSPTSALTNIFKVTVHFGTQIMAFPVHNNEFDADKFWLKTNQLARELAKLDGIVGCEMYLDAASLTFDTLLTDVEKVQAHIRAVLLQPLEEESNLFPFANRHELRLGFTVQALG